VQPIENFPKESGHQKITKEGCPDGKDLRTEKDKPPAGYPQTLCFRIDMKRRNSIFFFVLILLAFSIIQTDSNASDLLKVERHLKRIIIDPGLGGNDKGAEGCTEWGFAKDINLEISKTLASVIQSQLDIEVLLTRQNDKKLSLKKRTEIINDSQSDLLISIQTNSHDNNQAKGIETYFLNLAVDERKLAQWIEKQPAYKDSSGELQNIIKDLLVNSKISESEAIAKHVQKSVCKHLNEIFPEVEDRGIKQAPFYILLGSNIPAIAIFAGFLSNPIDCKMLSSEKYQKELSVGIVKGIIAFMNDKRL
jgi:N-acetylmuramoyl-L-alanine amidase